MSILHPTNTAREAQLIPRVLYTIAEVQNTLPGEKATCNYQLKLAHLSIAMNEWNSYKLTHNVSPQFQQVEDTIQPIYDIIFDDPFYNTKPTCNFTPQQLNFKAPSVYL